MDAPVFLAIREAAERVVRDPQTIRNWANTGRVRRRTRGRIVEYHEGDLLAVAGLVELDERDREIARLRVELSQAQKAKDLAEDMAKRRKESNEHLKQLSGRRYQEKDAQLADLVQQLQTATAQIDDLTKRNTAGRKRLAELEVQLKAVDGQVVHLQHEVTRLKKRALQINADWIAMEVRLRTLTQSLFSLQDGLFSVLTRREHKDRNEELRFEFEDYVARVNRLVLIHSEEFKQ